jgi:hypothetical protein
MRLKTVRANATKLSRNTLHIQGKVEITDLQSGPGPGPGTNILIFYRDRDGTKILRLVPVFFLLSKTRLDI